MQMGEINWSDKSAAAVLQELEAILGKPFKEILNELSGAEPLAAWLSGSRVECLDHASSDIDIYLAVDDVREEISPTRKDDGFYVKIDFVNSQRIDFEYWPMNRINSLADKLANAPISEKNVNIHDYFPDYELEFMHRLHIGIPLVGREVFAHIRDTFDPRRLSHYLLENKRLYLDDAFDDTVGMLKEGHLSSAALRARYTLEASVDMLLYSYGINNSKEKHRIRLFLRLLRERPELGSVYERFWNMMIRIPASDEGMLEYVEDALRFSEELVDNIQRRWE